MPNSGSVDKQRYEEYKQKIDYYGTAWASGIPAAMSDMLETEKEYSDVPGYRPASAQTYQGPSLIDGIIGIINTFKHVYIWILVDAVFSVLLSLATPELLFMLIPTAGLFFFNRKFKDRAVGVYIGIAIFIVMVSTYLTMAN